MGGTVSRCATVNSPRRAPPRAARARRAIHPSASRTDTEEKGPVSTVERNVTQTKDNTERTRGATSPQPRSREDSYGPLSGFLSLSVRARSVLCLREDVQSPDVRSRERACLRLHRAFTQLSTSALTARFAPSRYAHAEEVTCPLALSSSDSVSSRRVSVSVSPRDSLG